MPARVGDRRKFGDEIGEWDGHDWIALPSEPTDVGSDDKGAPPPARTLPFKGATRPVSEEEWQAAQTANDDPLRKGIAFATDVGLGSMLPVAKVLQMAPRLLSPAGKALEMGSRIPTVRGGARILGKAMQRAGDARTAAPVAQEAAGAATTAGSTAQAVTKAAAAPVDAHALRFARMAAEDGAKHGVNAAETASKISKFYGIPAQEAEALAVRAAATIPKAAPVAARAAPAAARAVAPAAQATAAPAASRASTFAEGTSELAKLLGQQPGVTMTQAASRVATKAPDKLIQVGEGIESQVVDLLTRQGLSKQQVANALREMSAQPGSGFKPLRPSEARQMVEMIVQQMGAQ